MAGWYKMYRGWMNDPLFGDEPMCRRAAWEFLIAEAAFEDHVQWFNGNRVKVNRGQFAASENSLAKSFGWTRKRVRTFLNALEMDGKLSRSGASGWSIITICNYEKFQLTGPRQGPTEGPTEGQQHKKGKENKKGKRKENYAFEGVVVRLTVEDFDLWRKRFNAIPDLQSELRSIDDWWSSKPESDKRSWFVRTSNMLARKHKEISERTARADDYIKRVMREDRANGGAS